MSRGTWDTARVPFDFDYAAITLYDWPFQAIRLSSDNPMSRSRNPGQRLKRTAIPNRKKRVGHLLSMTCTNGASVTVSITTAESYARQ